MRSSAYYPKVLPYSLSFPKHTYPIRLPQSGGQTGHQCGEIILFSRSLEIVLLLLPLIEIPSLLHPRQPFSSIFLTGRVAVPGARGARDDSLSQSQPVPVAPQLSHIVCLACCSTLRLPTRLDAGSDLPG